MVVTVLTGALLAGVGQPAMAQAWRRAHASPITVQAREPWNDSGLSVAAGQRLRITATGEWTDWTIKTDPAGFTRASMKPFEGMRRAPKAPWFALIGCVERSKANCFVVGREVELAAPTAGRLYFFANDVSFMNWNNKGHVEVVVETAAGGPTGS